MTEILKLIKERRSIRLFGNKKISPAAVEKLKQALIWAPSAGNLQARKFYFVFNQAIKKRLAEAYSKPREFISQAPLVIVACVEPGTMAKFGERGRKLYLYTDIAASIQNATLVAHELGLGSCWIGAFDEAAVARILDLPATLEPCLMLPVGYPAETPEVRPRVSPAEAIKEIN